jgi:ATP phosphoribosyltransferase
MLLSILYPAEVLLFKNNLKEVEIIYKSEAVLAVSQSNSEAKN